MSLCYRSFPSPLTLFYSSPLSKGKFLANDLEWKVTLEARNYFIYFDRSIFMNSLIALIKTCIVSLLLIKIYCISSSSWF